MVTADERLRAIRHTRQYREFEPRPVEKDDLDALVDIGKDVIGHAVVFVAQKQHGGCSRRGQPRE